MIWEWFLGLGLAGFIGYTLVPDLLFHRLGLGSWKDQLGPGVVLTFDDGPDPEMTPRLLDLLDARGLKAVFFLVSDQARRYPELTREIAARGHQIGYHGKDHRHAWITGPRQTGRTLSAGRADLEAVLGHPVQFMRPPWGVVNLMTIRWLRKSGMTAVGWSAQGQDWKLTDAEAIAGRILRRVHEGTIILLHDARKHTDGETMERILDQLIHRITGELKIPLVPLTIPRFSLGRQIILRVWNIWERTYDRLERVQRIGADNIFRINLKTYRGEPILDETGHVLARTGDLVGELHLNNLRVMTEETEPARVGIALLRKTRASLPGVAAFVAAEPDFAAVPVLVSETVVHRGLKGLGFTVMDLPEDIGNRWIGGVQLMIQRVYHPGADRSRMGLPKQVWISREQLMDKWLKPSRSPVKAKAGEVEPIQTWQESTDLR